MHAAKDYLLRGKLSCQLPVSSNKSGFIQWNLQWSQIRSAIILLQLSPIPLARPARGAP
jgi:hypothetical protein